MLMPFHKKKVNYISLISYFLLLGSNDINSAKKTIIYIIIYFT